jgi:RNA polymerase sigma factor (sigma-70 family)
MHAPQAYRRLVADAKAITHTGDPTRCTMPDQAVNSRDPTPSTSELLGAASQGDQGAWQALVEQYSAAIAAVTRAYRLDAADAGDVHQTTWLRLIEYKDRIREPERLRAWLTTAARNECLRIQRCGRRSIPVGDDLDRMADSQQAISSSPEDEVILAERNALLKDAVAALPVNHRSLIDLLMADAAPSYEELSAMLRIPVGSIGPTRGRCLAKLRTQLAVLGVI